MHEERPSYLQRSRMATEDIKTNIMPFFFLLLWAGGREESVQGSEGEYGGQKKKAKTTEMYQRHMQRKRKEVHNSGGFSCVKVKTLYV